MSILPSCARCSEFGARYRQICAQTSPEIPRRRFEQESRAAAQSHSSPRHSVFGKNARPQYSPKHLAHGHDRVRGRKLFRDVAARKTFRSHRAGGRTAAQDVDRRAATHAAQMAARREMSPMSAFDLVERVRSLLNHETARRQDKSAARSTCSSPRRQNLSSSNCSSPARTRDDFARSFDYAASKISVLHLWLDLNDPDKSASASPPRPPVICTSAGRAPRFSTGSSPGITAAN